MHFFDAPNGKLVKTIYYTSLDGENVMVKAGTLIKVDKSEGIALMNNHHVQVSSDEYVLFRN